MDWSIYRVGGERTFVPPGYCYMPQIADAIGKAMHGGEWIGNECAFESHMLSVSVCAPQDAFAAPDSAPDSFLAAKYAAAVRFWSGSQEPFADITQPTWEEWSRAYDRWAYCFEHEPEIRQRKRRACAALHRAAVTGMLPFVVRMDDGAWRDVPAHYWNCDEATATARIALGRIDMDRPMDAPAFSDGLWRARQRDWLFAPLDAVNAVRDALGRGLVTAIEQQEETEPRAALPVVATAAAIRECKAWLRGEFGRSETAGTTKAEFRETALAKWSGRMSARAFDNAWSEVVKSFPDRAKSGPRRGNS